MKLLYVNGIITFPALRYSLGISLCGMLLTLSACGRRDRAVQEVVIAPTDVQFVRTTPEAGSMLRGHSDFEAGSTLSPSFHMEAGSTFSGRGRSGFSTRDLSPGFQPMPMQPRRPRITDSQRMLELNAILANREFHRSLDKQYGSEPVYEELKGVPEENMLELVSIDRKSFPNKLKAALKEKAGQNVTLSLSYIQGEVGEELNAILDEGDPITINIPEIQSVRINSTRLSPEAWDAIARLPKLECLELNGTSMTDKELLSILDRHQLSRLQISYGVSNLSVDSLLQIQHQKSLRRLKIDGLTFLNQPKRISEFLTTLGQLSGLEELHISLPPNERISREEIAKFVQGDFLSGPIKETLKVLRVYNVSMPEKCIQDLPQLEKLSASIQSSPYQYPITLRQLSQQSPQIRILSLSDRAQLELNAKQAQEVIGALSAMKHLEEFRTRVIVDGTPDLESLTRHPKLRKFYGLDIKVDHKTLYQLSRMPHLEEIGVGEFAFDIDSQHLCPWLTNVRSIHIEEPCSLTDERFHMLATIPQLEGISFWSKVCQRPKGFSWEIASEYPHIQVNEYD